MANTTKKLEKFLADVDDMDLPTSFKNEVGRVARKEGIKAAGNLIAMSLNITKGVDDIPIPKKKPKKPMNKGGIIENYTKVVGSNITKVGGIPVIKITEGQRGDNIKIGAPIKSTLLK